MDMARRLATQERHSGGIEQDTESHTFLEICPNLKPKSNLSKA